MTRVVEHVAKPGFKEDSAAVCEVARGLLRISVDIELFFALLDGWERRRGSDDRLLPRRGVHPEVFDAARN